MYTRNASRLKSISRTAAGKPGHGALVFFALILMYGIVSVVAQQPADKSAESQASVSRPSAPAVQPVTKAAPEEKSGGAGALDSDLVITSESNEITFVNGEVTITYTNNVVARLDDITIRSKSATGMRKQGIWSFDKGVVIDRGSEKIRCNRVSFSKASKLIHATGNFVFTDTVEKTRLSGREADFHTVNKTFNLRGDPRLTKIDTAAAETLVITGVDMQYLDTLKRATASKNVKITKGKLVSTCQTAHYFTKDNIAWLRTDPVVDYEIHRVVGDSINLYFGKEALKSAVVMGNSHGLYVDTSGSSGTSSSGSKKKEAEVRKVADQSPLSRDTMYTHIWSDSLYMTISDSGYLDSLWAYGKVTSKYYSSSDPNSANQANGKTMLLGFTKTGNLDKIRIWGNARSIYFVDEPDGQGRNEASGDTIMVMFNPNGRARHLSLTGRARGMYCPNQELAKND